MVRPETKIRDLRKGLANFLVEKFKGFNIKSSLEEKGYHMGWRNVDYTMDFVYDENMRFVMEVDLETKKENLEGLLFGNKVSNNQLNRTKYLANQKIYANGETARVSCRLKRIPETDKEIKQFCSQLWGNVIKKVMGAVYY